MGMDIYSKSGVVFTMEDISSMLFGRLKNSAVEKVTEDLRTNWNEDWGDKTCLDEVRDASSLSNWLCSFASSLVRDDYLDETTLGQVWDVVTESTGISDQLPIASFDYWTHSRISGWEVPTDVPCIVFEESGLFETKMTKEGKNFAKLIGQKSIKSTTWTVMSV